MLKKVKSINLFLTIEYQCKGEYSTMDDEGRYTPEPEGWYYTGKQYIFNENIDLQAELGSNFSGEAKEIENPTTAKNRNYLLNQLRKYNNKQLKLLCSETNYWNDKNNLSSLPNPKIQKIIQFYETILYDFQHWYEKTNTPIPEECSHPILKTLIETSKEDLKKEKTKMQLFHWNLGMLELQNFYDALVDDKYINGDMVAFDNFIKIFEGKSIVKQNDYHLEKIRWLGKQNEIVYLMGRLAREQIIGYGNQWIAVESNFIKKNSEGFKHKVLSSIYSTSKFPKNTAKIDSIISSANQKIEK